MDHIPAEVSRVLRNEWLLTVVEAATELDNEIARLKNDLAEAQRRAAQLEDEVDRLCDRIYELQGEWDKAIDPDNLPQREDRDWREVVSRSAELLQAILVDLDRWLYEPLEEEEA